MPGLPKYVIAARAAVKELGGLHAVVKKYRVSRQRVEQWEKNGIPLKALNLISRDSGIPLEDLCPKVWDISSKPVPALQKPRNRKPAEE